MSDNTCPYYGRVSDWDYRGWPRPEYCFKNEWNPTDKRLQCYCLRNGGRDCYHMGGDDPYDLDPGLTASRNAARQRAERAEAAKKQKAAEKAQKRSDDAVEFRVELIDELPDEATLASAKKIRRARYRLRDLNTGERSRVYNIQKLEDLEAQLKVLLNEEWESKKRTMPEVEVPEGAEAPKMGLAKFLVWLNNFLVKACKLFDPRRYKTKNPLRSCPLVLFILSLINLYIKLPTAPKNVWISLMVFLGIMWVSRVVASIKPTAIWVRGIIWALAFIALLVFVIILFTNPLWLTNLKWLAVYLAWYPILMLIGGAVSAMK